MKSTDLNGYDENGTCWRISGSEENPAVVLIHGVGLDHEMWSEQVKALSGNFCVVRYDMLGHGCSPNPPGSRKIDDFVLQLVHLLEHLRIKRLHLVGFSMGALVAQAYTAANCPTVDRLVLMNSIFKRSDAQRQAILGRVAEVQRNGPAANVEPALQRWFTPGFRQRFPKIIEAVRMRVESNDPDGYLKAYRVFATADLEVGSRLSAISCPTLVVTGEDDVGSTPEMTRRIAERITGAEAKILPGARHMACVEFAETISSLLSDFLSESGTAR
jgi:3-oxoadipate enol-lactonase